MLAASATLLVRFGPALVNPLIGIRENGPPCPAAVDRWADQRLASIRSQLEQEHGLYRTEGVDLNAITATMNWIDDRLIDQHVSEERRRLRASVLQSAHCVPRFSS